MTGLGILGTPAYMAPEIWQGGPATPASDQYALACTLFELLAGTPPFGDGGDLRDAHLNDPPPELGQMRADVSTTVALALAGGLAKHAGERFSDVRAFAIAAGTPGSEAVRQSDEANRLLAAAAGKGDAVTRLVEHVGYSESRAGAVVGVSRAEVVRLRRRETRRQLMGE